MDAGGFGKRLSAIFGSGKPLNSPPEKAINSFASSAWVGYSPAVDRWQFAMKRFSSLRVRLVGIVLLTITPVVALLTYLNHGEFWVDFIVGFTALAAAWAGGELFVLKQVRIIMQ